MIEGLHPYAQRFVQRHFMHGIETPRQLEEAQPKPFAKLPEITNAKALEYSEDLVHAVEKEYGYGPYPVFESKMLAGIAAMHDATKRFAASVAQTPEQRKMNFVSTLFKHLPEDRSFGERLNDIKATVEHLPAWKKYTEEKSRHYSISRGVFAHPEAMFVFAIERRKGLFRKREKLATVGFNLRSRPTGTVLSITSIQGERGKAAELERLSEKIGESWRKIGVKRAMAYAGENEFGVEGELPKPPETWPGFDKRTEEEKRVLSEDYARQVHRYERTYRQLGFRKTGNRWVLPQ